MKRVILFDFDGVIADSFHVAFAVAKMVRPTLTLESYREKWNTNINKAVWAEPKSDTPVDFQYEYAQQMKLLELSPEKKKVLQRLSEHFDFHIISSTNTKTIVEFCKVHGIHHYFSDIVGRDVEASKVIKFQTLFSKYHLDAEDLIFVTDTVGDIEEAREVGIGTIIAVADGYQDRAVLEKAEPTHIIDSIADLEKVIEVF